MACLDQNRWPDSPEYANGIEIIQNHLNPYPVKSGATDFKLEEEGSINFGSPEIGELGIADAMDFEVDREGFINFHDSHKKGDTIFKFGPDGKFIMSWAPNGQGPGEVRFISSACVTSQGHLIVSDHASKKLIWFTDEGKLVKELRYPPDGRYYIIYPINEDRFIGYAREITDPAADYFNYVFYLLNESLEELKKLSSSNPAGLRNPVGGSTITNSLRRRLTPPAFTSETKTGDMKSSSSTCRETSKEKSERTTFR